MISKDKTFNDDKLERRTFIRNTMNIINDWYKTFPTEDSVVIAINAGWGNGKSYLINMWKNWILSSDEKPVNYSVVTYNAWENDDQINAFLPLAYEIKNIETYGDDYLLTQRIANGGKEFIKACSIALLKDGTKKIIGEETSKILIEGIDGFKEGKIESYFENYKIYKDQKEVFGEALDDLVPRGGKLIIMIDELDRCRPNFAIETLEIIKHYFNRKNIIFLIALDIEQLSHSVSTLYGQNMDSEGYLRRFFDLTLNLPKHDGLEYLTSTYRPLLNSTEIPSGFISIMANLYSKLDLSLRDIDKITNSFIIFCLFYKDTIYNMRYDLKTLEFYLYFIILKHKYPNTYKHILRVGFMDPSDRPENFPYLDKKYFVSDNINFILKEMQNGAAQQANGKLNGTYGFIQCNKESRSFGENIEKVIEMFI